MKLLLDENLSDRIPPALLAQFPGSSHVKHEGLSEILTAHPELRATFEKLDDEARPHTFSQFVSQVLLKALPVRLPEQPVDIVDRLIQLLSNNMTTKDVPFTKP